MTEVKVTKDPKTEYSGIGSMVRFRSTINP